ncbi:class I SAM-dependent methyltransferase [Gaetbulibacter sp. NE]|uniref:class I SAM-dependent methyltransferase n=1 Tax=Gaetbulibacter sp. NE TaxID=2982307 RepID=UPI0021D25C7D|nr:class I SAM-dependent methyltransferase [Gaetbulibacter sp. NE]
MDKTLTSKSYWENYYKANHAQRQHIIDVCSYYDGFWSQFFDAEKGKTFIEIGGFPGRYLAYVAARYGVTPTCLDYNSNTSQITSTFEVMGVTSYHILQEDFLNYSPKQTYDYVFSNGFIEHFEDFDHVMDLHLRYLKPGGRLMVMVPNKRYLRRWYGYLCDYDNLKAHNLKCMKLSVFKAFAKRHNLETKVLQYYGGFPFSVHQKLNVFQRLLFKVTRLLFKKGINPILMKHPSKYFSSTIIAQYEKPLDS